MLLPVAAGHQQAAAPLRPQASVRLASRGGGTPTAERMSSCGMLTQWLQAHKKHAGADPSVPSRAQALSRGAPLASRRKA
eukprot:15051337-Alexandrium_andersonii.AAC.1